MPQRLFALLLCAALLISAVPPALAEDQPIEAERFVAPTLPPDAIAWDKNHPDILDEDMLYAHSAILIEADTGEVLFEKNADEIMFPASTTKIMTAYIALQMSDLENDVVTVSQNAIDLVPPTYQTIPLIAGEQVPMLDLISVMLIRSGNEAANAVAEYLAGSVESFADLMNQTAQMLGCSPNTHFANPSGVHDENHYTTARDLAVIAQACMKDERFASIVSQTSYDMPATQTESGAAGHPRRTIVGSTAILNPENETSYYRYATGVKTGYTLAAGYCFVGSATKGGIDLISVVLYDGDTRRYEDTKRLFEYGFTQIESITPESLYAEDPRVIDVTVGITLSTVYVSPVLNAPLPTPVPPSGEDITSTIESSSATLRRIVPLPLPVFTVTVYCAGVTCVRDVIDAPMTPVVESVKSFTSTPVTFSLNVTVKFTFARFVGLPFPRTTDTTDGGVRSIV